MTFVLGLGLLAGCSVREPPSAVSIQTGPETFDAGLFLQGMECTYSFAVPLEDFVRATEVESITSSCECVVVEPFPFLDNQSRKRCGLSLRYEPQKTMSITTDLLLLISVTLADSRGTYVYQVKVSEAKLDVPVSDEPLFSSSVPDPVGL